MNYNIQIDLMKVMLATTEIVAGARVLRIPIDQEGLSVQNGSVFLRLTALNIQTPGRQHTHLLKQQFGKDYLAGLGEEDRRRIPFIGYMVPWAPDGKAHK